MLLNYINKGFVQALCAASLFVGFKAVAQEKDSIEHDFSLSFQYRPKLEFRDGYLRPLMKNEKPAAFISDRIRLQFDYTYKNVLSIRVTPQDVNIWGQSNMIQGVENSGSHLSMFETWAKVRMSNSWSAKVGRQVIALDDERLFGEVDWAQGGRAHDAVAFEFAKKGYEVKGFFAYNQNYKALYNNNLYNPTGNLYSSVDAYPHKWMQTVWAAIPIKSHSKITMIASNIGFQSANVGDSSKPEYFMQTYGANYFFKNKGFDVQVAGYFQAGKNSVGRTIEAYMGTINAGYAINKHWYIGIGSDIVSGSNVGSAQKRNTTFNPIFHTGHKFYGHMDYFFAGNAHKNAGLSDNYLKVSFKTEKGFGINLVAHQFFTTNKVVDLTQSYKANLGQEFDLFFSYQIYKFVSLTGGYSGYVTTTTINYLKNTVGARSYQQWAWLSLKVNPTLFKFKK